MIKTDYQEEFKNLCLQLESFENQLRNTLALDKKNKLRQNIKNIRLKIDNILDEYNREGISYDTKIC